MIYFLKDELFAGKVTEKQLIALNNKLSHGVIAWTVSNDEEPLILGFNPDKFKYIIISENFTEIATKTLQIFRKSEPNQDIHTTFPFTIHSEDCTVFSYVFNLETSNDSETHSFYILTMIFRPPWGTSEKLATYIWKDQGSSSRFFGQIQKLKALIKEKTDNKEIQAELEHLRVLYTAIMVEKKQIKFW